MASLANLRQVVIALVVLALVAPAWAAERRRPAPPPRARATEARRSGAEERAYESGPQLVANQVEMEPAADAAFDDAPVDADAPPAAEQFDSGYVDESAVAEEAAPVDDAAMTEEGEIIPAPDGEGYDVEFEYDYPHFAGTCNDENCDQCRNWYFRTDFVLINRTRSRENTVSRIQRSFTNNLLQTQVVLSGVQGTKTLAFALEPGARFTIGRYLGRDAQNRDHLIEASYLGFARFGSESAVRGDRRTFVAPDLVNTFTGGSLFSNFGGVTNNVNIGGVTVNIGNFAPGFSHADLHALQYTSTFHDLQINRKVRRGLRRGRLVYQPGGWTHQSPPGFTPSLVGGLRFLQITEDFGFHSEGVIESGGNQFAFTGDYNVTTHNHLFGGQIGVDVTQQFENWGFGFIIRNGLFSNFAGQDSLIQVNDPTPFKQGLFPSNRAYSFDNVSMSFLGELGVDVNYRFNRNLTFRANYSLLWVIGLALAPEQLDFTNGGPARLNYGGRTTFQWGTAGLEMVF